MFGSLQISFKFIMFFFFWEFWVFLMIVLYLILMAVENIPFSRYIYWIYFFVCFEINCVMFCSLLHISIKSEVKILLCSNFLSPGTSYIYFHYALRDLFSIFLLCPQLFLLEFNKYVLHLHHNIPRLLLCLLFDIKYCHPYF